MKVVTETGIKEFPLLSRGKVRDIYAIDDETLLLVTTDRMSAFDVIMNEPVPYKGVVLNQITLFWMDRLKDVVPNHILESDASRYPAALRPYADMLEGRSVLARRARPLPVECIVRGFLSGSGWKAYQKDGAVCGHALPAGLRESERLPRPIFTPSTKAAIGEHDENITAAQAAALVGEETAGALERVSLRLFEEASRHAASTGIILADTKFEFGLAKNADGKEELIWIDEALTPDSSRFWASDAYEPGRAQPSFDKQYLRDWLAGQKWNFTPPPPALPREVVEQTRDRYFEAYRRLTGKTLAV